MTDTSLSLTREQRSNIPSVGYEEIVFSPIVVFSYCLNNCTYLYYRYIFSTFESLPGLLTVNLWEK